MPVRLRCVAWWGVQHWQEGARRLQQLLLPDAKQLPIVQLNRKKKKRRKRRPRQYDVVRGHCQNQLQGFGAFRAEEV